MAQKLSVNFTGDVEVKVDSATCASASNDPGQAFKFGLLDINKQADIEQSNKLLPVDASGGAVPLPFPANLQGKVLYLRVLNRSGPMDVQVTHSTQGATIYPVQGLLLLEPADDEYITGVSILTGSGEIEWFVTGLEA